MVTAVSRHRAPASRRQPATKDRYTAVTEPNLTELKQFLTYSELTASFQFVQFCSVLYKVRM